MSAEALALFCGVCFVVGFFGGRASVCLARGAAEPLPRREGSDLGFEPAEPAGGRDE